MFEFDAYLLLHDSNYPGETTYTSKIRLLSDPPRSAITAIYALLHWVDDVTDDPGQSAAQRYEEYNLFLECFGAAVRNVPFDPIIERMVRRALLQKSERPQGVKDPLSRANALGPILLECQRQWQHHGISDFRSYDGLFSVLIDIASWWREVRFDTVADLEEYISHKFAFIVNIFMPVLSGNIGVARRKELADEFLRLMTAMQMVNILMDVEEDWRAGQVWLPRTLLSGSALRHILATPPKVDRSAKRTLLAIADSNLSQIELLWHPRIVGQGEAMFFNGLREIYDKLKVVILD